VAFLEIGTFWYLRNCTGKARRDRIINTQVRGMLNEEPVTKMVERMELRWFGHLIRMDSNKKPWQLRDARVEGMCILLSRFFLVT